MVEQEKKMSTLVGAFAASTGAMMTSIFVTPLDVVKTRMQSTLLSPSQPNTRTTTTTTRIKSMMCQTRQKSLATFRFPTPLLCRRCMRSISCSCVVIRNTQSVHPLPCRGTFSTLKHIFQSEGLFGLWTGFSPSMLSTVPSTVIYFTTYDTLLEKGNEHLPYTYLNPMLSGSVARIIATFFVSPLEMTRTRMQSSSSSIGMLKTMSLTISQSGYVGLYRGVLATLARDVPFSAIYWTCFEMAKETSMKWNEHEKPFLIDTFTSGAFAGAIAATITTPVDVLKTLRQMERTETSSVSSRPLSAISLWKNLYISHGIKGCFTGLEARLLRIPPACAIMISTYESCKQWLS